MFLNLIVKQSSCAIKIASSDLIKLEPKNGVDKVTQCNNNKSATMDEAQKQDITSLTDPEDDPVNMLSPSSEDVEEGSSGVTPNTDSDGEDPIEKLKKKISLMGATPGGVLGFPGAPSTHTSQQRQTVSGKIFKKCKSATFQIDGATYTIGK